ncbi:uncharacterized protein OCT59_014730 [Rhizophagus irregularis]|uniref:uncharacterized protein n=1 Tax=Rhizophagus irregularis TaxID=588596 RepID=UPI0033308C74|nr:hypothetical protein OCT59_014730 [Rhizophagus irregularis]
MTSMSYWYEQLTKIKGNEQMSPMAQTGLEENKSKNYTLQFFGNDLSVEDFWMVLYFQTLPYGTLDL